MTKLYIRIRNIKLIEEFNVRNGKKKESVREDSLLEISESLKYLKQKWHYENTW